LTATKANVVLWSKPLEPKIKLVKQARAQGRRSVFFATFFNSISFPSIPNTRRVLRSSTEEPGQPFKIPVKKPARAGPSETSVPFT
jgi:hypothetical protein